MSGGTVLLVAIGALALLAGLVMVAKALRGAPGTSRKSTGLLMGGMMTAAFGLILGGFAIGYATTEPLDYGAEPAR